MFFINPEAMWKEDKQWLNSNCYRLNLNILWIDKIKIKQYSRSAYAKQHSLTKFYHRLCLQISCLTPLNTKESVQLWKRKQFTPHFKHLAMLCKVLYGLTVTEHSFLQDQAQIYILNNPGLNIHAQLLLQCLELELK